MVHTTVVIVHALPYEPLSRLERASISRFQLPRIHTLVRHCLRVDVQRSGWQYLSHRGDVTRPAHALRHLIDAAPVLELVLPIGTLQHVRLKNLHSSAHHDALHVNLSIRIDEVGIRVVHNGAVLRSTQPDFRRCRLLAVLLVRQQRHGSISRGSWRCLPEVLLWRNIEQTRLGLQDVRSGRLGAAHNTAMRTVHPQQVHLGESRLLAWVQLGAVLLRVVVQVWRVDLELILIESPVDLGGEANSRD